MPEGGGYHLYHRLLSSLALANIREHLQLPLAVCIAFFCPPTAISTVPFPIQVCSKVEAPTIPGLHISTPMVEIKPCTGFPYFGSHLTYNENTGNQGHERPELLEHTDTNWWSCDWILKTWKKSPPMLFRVSGNSWKTHSQSLGTPLQQERKRRILQAGGRSTWMGHGRACGTGITNPGWSGYRICAPAEPAKKGSIM